MMPSFTSTLPTMSSGNGMRPQGGGFRSSPICIQLIITVSKKTKSRFPRHDGFYPSFCHLARLWSVVSFSLCTFSRSTSVIKSTNLALSRKVLASTVESSGVQPIISSLCLASAVSFGRSLLDKNESAYRRSGRGALGDG